MIEFIQKLSTEVLLAAINEADKLRSILSTNRITAEFKPISVPVDARYRISSTPFKTEGAKLKLKAQTKDPIRAVKFNHPITGETGNPSSMYKLRSSPSSAGKIDPSMEINRLTKAIINHLVDNYTKMDRDSITRAFGNLTETDIRNLATDQNSLHNYGLGIGQTKRLDQYGAKEHGSNMLKAYKISIEKQNQQASSLGKRVFTSLLSEAVTMEHILYLLAKKQIFLL